MELRRQLLYGGYKLGKKTGIISLWNLAFVGASVLIFHKVNDRDKSELSVSTTLFEKVIEKVTEDYKVISLESLIGGLKENRKIPSGTVVVTFDDGYQDNFLHGAQILKKYSITATFFVTSGYVGSKRSFSWDKGAKENNPIMSWDEVRELSQMGFEIGGHTINHVNLGKVSLDEAEKEIRGCKEKIEDEIGKEVNKFAYPFGRKEAITNEVVELVKKAGFKCCCSGYGGKVINGSDPFCLQRIGMYPNLTDLLMEIDNFHTFINGRMKFGT
ncbi:MAG: polysaccharide deacetylase family protein [Deltaproteobacteria bacterium]